MGGGKSSEKNDQSISTVATSSWSTLWSWKYSYTTWSGLVSNPKVAEMFFNKHIIWSFSQVPQKTRNEVWKAWCRGLSALLSERRLCSSTLAEAPVLSPLFPHFSYWLFAVLCSACRCWSGSWKSVCHQSLPYTNSSWQKLSNHRSFNRHQQGKVGAGLKVSATEWHYQAYNWSHQTSVVCLIKILHNI